MQDYIDIIIKYWYVFLPLLIAIFFVIVLLARQGYLQEINIFGFKVNFKRETSKEATYIDNPLKDVPTLREYKVMFSKTALENITILRLSQEKIINLVENEFTHHINYFKWDLLDYPLPVQDGYIVVLDKIGLDVTFRSIKQSDLNELELASLNDLLAIYRRLSRFEYRINSNIILRTETIDAISSQHKEVIKRLIRHYEIFRKILLPNKERFPIVFLSQISETEKTTRNEGKLKAYVDKLPPNTRGFGLNVVASFSALHEIEELIANEENNLLSQQEAQKEIVLCLERSLQYIHKMINACLE